MPGMAASNSSATVRSCTAEFCLMSSRARWKPKQSTARRKSRSRPRAITLELFAISLEFLHARVRRAFADRTPCGLDFEFQRSRSQPGIDAGNRQSVRFAATVRRGIWRAPSQRPQLFGNIGKMSGERQLGAEFVQLLEIEIHHPARLQPQRAAHDVRRDERVAV